MSRQPPPPLTTEQQAVVQANLLLVWKAVTRQTVRRSMHPGTSFDDLAQAGFLALCRAARNYDPTAGVQFSTYATVSIKNAIFDELCYKSSLIHVPLDAVGIRPGETRLDAVFRLRPMQLKTASETFLRHGGEWMPDSDYEPKAPVEDIDEELDSQNRAAVLHDSLEAMPERARHILRARWFDGRTLQDIGNELRLSKERVRQLEVKALRDLKDHLEARMGSRHCD